jgi:hypothetical protein
VVFLYLIIEQAYARTSIKIFFHVSLIKVIFQFLSSMYSNLWDFLIAPELLYIRAQSSFPTAEYWPKDLKNVIFRVGLEYLNLYRHLRLSVCHCHVYKCYFCPSNTINDASNILTLSVSS